VSDGDEFDPSAAAARAVGDFADEDVGGGTGGGDPDPASTASDEGGSPESPDDSDSADDSDASGLAATFLLPLFLADERGPTSSTFRDHDVPEGLSLMLDGLTDYILDLAGRDVGDSLGPAGKMSLGYSRLAGGSSTEGDGDRDGDHDDRGDDGTEIEFEGDLGESV